MVLGVWQLLSLGSGLPVVVLKRIDQIVTPTIQKWEKALNDCTYILWLALLVVLGSVIGISIRMTLHDYHSQQGQCPEQRGIADMYGIGIRISVYLQLFRTVTIDQLYPNHAAAMAPANMWVFFALNAALWVMLSDRTVSTVDQYLVIALGNGIADAAIRGNVGDSRRRVEPAVIILSRRVVIFSWRVSVFLFWWYRLPASEQRTNQTQRDLGTPCGPFGWLFTKMPLSTGTAFYLFHQVYSMGALIYAGIWMLNSIFTLGTLYCFLVQLPRSHQKLSNRTWLLLLHYSVVVPQCDLILIIRGPCASSPDTTFKQLLSGNAKELEERCLSHVVHQYSLSRSVVDLQELPNWEHLQREQKLLCKHNEQRTGLLKSFYAMSTKGATILFTILTVEITLKLNKVVQINDLLAVGQIVALLIAVGELGTLTMNLCSDYCEEKDKQLTTMVRMAIGRRRRVSTV
ncbi:hypothetical protein BDZ91DRAFT_853834 [Kalaharituber pfeilii]|nr:hypothetical protein BDZ91DRAFT_853834 [Kalaharituber pfeilii]